VFQKSLQLSSKSHRSNKHFDHLLSLTATRQSKEKAVLSAISAWSLNPCKDLYIFVAVSVTQGAENYMQNTSPVLYRTRTSLKSLIKS